MVQYLKIGTIGSIGSIILAILEVQVLVLFPMLVGVPQTPEVRESMAQEGALKAMI